MNELFRRHLEKLARVRVYGATHKSSFPAGSRGAQLFASLESVITELQTLSGNQASRTALAREITTSKSLARESLTEELEAISLTAKAMAVTKPGLDDKFPMPRNPADQVLLASARGFAKDAALLKAEFIDFDMPADFLEDLDAAIGAFEAALSDRHTTRHSRVETTAAMDSVLDRGIAIVKQLDAVMTNKFRDDDALLLGWSSARRTEHSRRSKRADEIPGSDGGPGKTETPPPKAAGQTAVQGE